MSDRVIRGNMIVGGFDTEEAARVEGERIKAPEVRIVSLHKSQQVQAVLGYFVVASNAPCPACGHTPEEFPE